MLKKRVLFLCTYFQIFGESSSGQFRPGSIPRFGVAWTVKNKISLRDLKIIPKEDTVWLSA